MRIALIANRASGGGLDVEGLASLMRRHDADVTVWNCAPEDLEAVRRSGPERIAVAGGDGTIGPAAELAGSLGVPLAVLPAGTANDFAAFAELPRRIEEACILAATGSELRPLELGRLADGRPFVNVASAGLAASAAGHADGLKGLLGPLAYPLGAVRAALTDRPLACRVLADGREVYASRAWQVTVAVTGAFGGGAEVGAADPEDGVLDLAVLPAGSRLGLARRAWGMRRGSIASQRDVCHVRGRVIEVELPPLTPFNVDGEVREDGMQRLSVEHRAYELVVG